MSALSFRTRALGLVGLAALGLTALPALAQGAVSPNYRWLTFAVFAVIIGPAIIQVSQMMNGQ